MTLHVGIHQPSRTLIMVIMYLKATTVLFKMS